MHASSLLLIPVAVGVFPPSLSHTPTAVSLVIFSSLTRRFSNRLFTFSIPLLQHSTFLTYTHR